MGKLALCYAGGIVLPLIGELRLRAAIRTPGASSIYL